MHVQIFQWKNDDGPSLAQFQNDVNCWLMQESPNIISMSQSESAFAQGTDGDQRALTLVFLVSPTGDKS